MNRLKRNLTLKGWMLVQIVEGHSCPIDLLYILEVARLPQGQAVVELVLVLHLVRHLLV